MIALAVGCQPPAILIAGTGKYDQQGYQDGIGKNARFRNPRIAFSEQAYSGLFIADQGNHRIRLMDDQGQVTSFAGTGKPNALAIAANSMQALNSDMYLPGAITVKEKKLYFTSPGCIRSIDLTAQQAELRIKTVFGTCLTESDLQELNKGSSDPDLRKTKDPFSLSSAQNIELDSQSNIYVRTGRQVSRFTQSGSADTINQVFNGAKGIGPGTHGNMNVFYEQYEGLPGGRPSVVDVSEILPDKSVREIKSISFGGIVAFAGDNKGNYYAVVHHAFQDKIFKIDKNLNAFEIGSVPQGGDTPVSIAVDSINNNLFISGVATIYKLKLKGSEL